MSRPNTRSQTRDAEAGPSTYSIYNSRNPFDRGMSEERPFESFTASSRPSLRTSTPNRRNRRTREQSPSDLDFDTAEGDDPNDTAQATYVRGDNRQVPEAPGPPTNPTEGNDGNGEGDNGDINPPERDGEDGIDPGDRMFLMLTRAITNLARTTRDVHQAAPRPEPPRRKVREPDQFDGSDPRKLRTFFVQCEINFNNRPRSFPTDTDKVTFVTSYLKGPALDWFEPDILRSHRQGRRPPWMDNYPRFVRELERNFGPHDPVGDAEEQIFNHVMKDGHKIGKYIIDFNRYASQLEGFGEGALRALFYRGLPDRIKDEITRFGKPASLYELRDLAQDVDARHWERKSQTDRRSKNTDTPETTAKPTKPSFPAKPSPASGSKAPKDKESGGKPAAKSDLASKLGKDGKLTKEERQRRFDNNLCMFCGKAGHVAKDCYKSGSSAAKARKATTETAEADSDASSEAKN
jgi:hypothetical protein